MTDDALCFLPAHQLAERIRTRATSPVEIVEAHLRRIESLNPKLSAYLTVTADVARAQAKEAEREIAGGHYRGPLHGVPYGAKDIFATAGIRTTHGSSFFRDNVPSQDAESVARLRQAGAILLGKCLTHEFAAASTTVNPHYGTARNPWNLDRIAGGSSGGSGVAVAAGLAPGALGSDTGGSIRIPAAFCGIVGLKPTHGRISLGGVCPNVLSFDHVGPMTRTVRDAALMLQAMAGYDPRDPWSQDVPVPDFSARIGAGVRGTRIGLCPELSGHVEVDAEVAEAFEGAVRVFERLGARIETVPFAYPFDRIVRAMTAILGAEFAEFHRPFYEKNPNGYGADVRERLQGAFKVTLDEHVRALRERELVRREVAALFRSVEAIIMPATVCTPAPIATLMARVNGKESSALWVHSPLLRPHNLTGCPAIALPMGFSRDQLPLSLQIVGPRWAEAEILQIAQAFEEATPEIHAKRPPGA